MKMKIVHAKLKTALKKAVLSGTGIALLISAMVFAGVFDKIELKILNTAFRERKPIQKRTDIITIDIDDSAVGTIDRWPWSWDKHALLLDFLTMYQARTVAFMDMDFSKEIPFGFPLKTVESYKGMLQSMAASKEPPGRILSVLPDFNAAFYSSLRKNGEACFTVGFKIPEAAGGGKSSLQTAETNAALYSDQKKEGIRLLKESIGVPAAPAYRPGSFPVSTDVLPLVPDILQYSSCSGFNAVVRERDGAVYKYPLMTYYRGSLYPSVGLQIARKYMDDAEVKIKDGEYIELRNKAGRVRIPVNRAGEMYINWPGAYGESFVHLPFNMVAMFMGYQMAKDELAAHSREELMKDPMALGQVIMQKLADSRLVPDDMGNEISAVTIISALAEHALEQKKYRTAEEVLSAVGMVDPKDEVWLGIVRQICFNNYLLESYQSSGKLPAFEAAIKGAGITLKKEKEPQFRDSYNTMAYFIEKNLVPDVRPLYFPQARISGPGKKELSITPLFFKDKIVFYGLTATGLAVQTASPFAKKHDMLDLAPSVLNTILTGQFIRELPPGLNYVVIWAYVLIVLLCVLLSSPLPGLAFVCLFAGAHLGIAWFSFSERGYILPVSPPLAALASSYLLAVVYRYFQEQRERRKVRNMFSTMVSPEVLRIVENNPDSFRLAGEKREATLFSSDVSGFTTISEGVTARELANILNIYLTPMSNIIMSYGGYVDKYEGDAIKADFGVPLDDPGHSWKACFSALYQQEELKVIQRMILLKYGVKITARMGINTGTVSAGNMGSERRMQYTVMGDAVALAEELEPANKIFGTWIAIGPETYGQAGNYIETRRLNNLVAGAAGHSIPVYELAGWKKEKFLEYWAGKPVPELALESLRKMLPEKVLAYHEFYQEKNLPESPLLKDFRELFSGLRGPAVEYMKVNNVRSVLAIREELKQLMHDLGADEQHAVSAGKEEWEGVALQWKRDLKQCSSVRRMLKEKITKEEHDRFLNVTDVLEKSVECIYKRITCAERNDPAALEMSEHLKELVCGRGLPEPADTGSLSARSASLESRINSRLAAFAEGLRPRAAEYHALISDFCVAPEGKRKVMELYRQGQELYLEKEWEPAAEKIKEALALMPDDGPSAKLLEKIKELQQEPPGEGWDGTWGE